MKTPKPNYIPEIDTLRAVAVLLVVVFHTSGRHMPGGYIGVDIFFVISGFVISRSYLNAMLEGDTSLWSFYLARFRRLLPAIFVVLLLTTIAAYLLILPSTLKLYAQSLLAQPFYLQNFVFWNEGDYFFDSLAKPLLHTWSLAVEEQFYLLFGLAILLLRPRPRLFLPLLGIAAIASLVLAIALSQMSPKSSFFMLPTRLWQFALGIGAFALAAHLGQRSSRWIDVLGAAALLCCVLVGYFLGAAGSFPALNAYAACLATACALVCFDIGPRSLSILRLAPLRYVGRISYGFYLWHWPPLVLYVLATDSWPSPGTVTMLVAVAFAGAVLSYHFVEQPIRRGTFLSQPAMQFRVWVGASAVSVCVAAALIFTDGAVYRYSPEIQKFFAATERDGSNRCPKSLRLANPSAEICLRSATQAGKGILLLGDSHADMLDEMLVELAEGQGLQIHLNVRSCDLGLYGRADYCGRNVLDRIIDQAKNAGISHVIAISRWPIERMTSEELNQQLDQLVEAGFEVTIMEAVPYGKDMDPMLRIKETLAGGELRYNGQSRKYYEAILSKQRILFEQASSRFDPPLEMLRPIDFLCNETECFYHSEGVPHYFDSRHLNATGREPLKPMFEAFFTELTQD